MCTSVSITTGNKGMCFGLLSYLAIVCKQSDVLTAVWQEVYNVLHLASSQVSIDSDSHSNFHRVLAFSVLISMGKGFRMVLFCFPR